MHEGGWARRRESVCVSGRDGTTGRGYYETARGVGGPDRADGPSWDETAGVAPGEQAGQAR